MTADEIHDQNMKEFADALGECAEACEKPREPFRPSNGTHGEIFEAAFCERCTKDSNCMIRFLTRCHQETDPEYPKEWVYGDDGQPTCTAFEVPAG